METAVIVFSVVARLLAVASAVLGFIAEAKKLTPNDISYSQGKCVYPASPAFALGICAVSLLAVAQIVVVSLAGSCSGHGGASGCRRTWGNVCYALSWVAAVISVALYVQGVVWNAATTRAPQFRGLFSVQCRYLQDAVFTRAALLSLVATALGIFSYVMLRAQAPPAATLPSTAPALPASGGPGPKPEFPPTGEAVAVPVEGYGRAWNTQRSRPPQRQAQPAYEVMMA